MTLPIKASGVAPSGEAFTEAGMLKNVSVWGALGTVQRALQVGIRIELSVKLPVVERWMIYTGEVVRVETDGEGTRFAMKFDSAAPDFEQG
jgi:hypothetical protein